MLYIFDQQKGTQAALGVTLDCILSLLRQWTLRPRIGMERPATPVQNATADNILLFETFDAFPLRKSAIIYGALLSLVLLYITVYAIPHSGIDLLNLHNVEIAINSIQQENAQTGRGMILLDQYVGQYISKNPSAKFSIQIEGDASSDNHLSLSLGGAGHSSLRLLPLSPTKFIILGARDSYVDFTADAQGRICCLSLVMNSNAVTAKRQ